MFWQNTLWPDAPERKLLGRFYLAGGISEALNVILPFQFVYLYLVMDRPEWAVTPLLVETCTIMLMEIPTGVVADRWGRKLSVIAGDSLSAIGWLLIPTTVALSGEAQLWGVCACFLLEGIGQTLVSGAEDAWVVDNLRSQGRKDLMDCYFARILSVGSLGGVLAGVIAVLLLIGATVNHEILNLLWYIAAAGQFIAVVIATTIPEHTTTKDFNALREHAKDFFTQLKQGLHALIRIRPLAIFLLIMVIVSFADSVVSDAFGISLVTKGMDARLLAPIGILDDLFGIISPLLGIAIARRLGLSTSLTLFLLIPALAVLLLFAQPGVWWVLGLYLLFNISAYLWDPVADTHLHTMIPSSSRATLGSVVNQATNLASLAGLTVFARLLGEHSAELQAATPDLIEAFSGGATGQIEVPSGLLGLPVPDMALVFFTLAGLLAIPLVWSIRRTDHETETP